MKKIIEWLLSLFNSNNPKAQDSSIVIKPIEPIQQIPAKKEIPDFHFVDTSHHHEDFDPKAYSYECKLLINKCTQGISMVDSTFQKRKELCKEYGIKYGGYHFYSCATNWKTQLDHYLKTHGEFEIAPILDYEQSGGNTLEQLKINLENAYKWMVEVKKITGKAPILYIGYSLAKELNLPEKWKEFSPWFPRYSSKLGEIPKPWTEDDVMGWQFTEDGLFPGFKGGNDVNIYYGKNNKLNLVSGK